MLDFQGIDSDIEEVTRPTENLDNLIGDHLDESGADDVPAIVAEDISTIPEEASEELRLEEEAEALEAALASANNAIGLRPADKIW